MQVEVLNIKGEKTGRNVELPNEFFGIEPNDHLIYLSVKQFLANRRSGTHKVKTRAEVHGASRKLHKQKGTGGARKGNIRNPLYKGGGTIFGPKPHKYDFKLNKQEKNTAFYSALSYKAKTNDIVVIEDIQFDAPSTKQFVGMVNNLQLNNAKVLFLMAEENDNLYLSSRNLPKVKTDIFYNTNTYDVLNASKLLLTENVVKQFSESEMEEVA
ncbi:MAG TPA: 50S ribosomal protein L4 [Chitinophagaceae bacterium]|nr:MAG: 50S ribosomal protein L4 [Bacteroidetes bacterium OLB11]HMN33438.1 50S ribosomal protein L4 [Chitinophagaceae bacterium]